LKKLIKEAIGQIKNSEILSSVIGKLERGIYKSIFMAIKDIYERV